MPGVLRVQRVTEITNSIGAEVLSWHYANQETSEIMADTSAGEKFCGSVARLSDGDFQPGMDGHPETVLLEPRPGWPTQLFHPSKQRFPMQRMKVRGSRQCTPWDLCGRESSKNDVGNSLLSLRFNTWMALAGQRSRKGDVSATAASTCALASNFVSGKSLPVQVSVSQRPADTPVTSSGKISRREEEMDEDNEYDSAMEGTDPCDGADVGANACATPSTSAGVEGEKYPSTKQDTVLDMTRVRLTYEAHPQYFPCKIRNDPIPQLIQNHEHGLSRTNSPCSSRISSSTGDYLESTDSMDFIRSPDENDGDDEDGSSDDNDDDQFSTFGTSDVAYRHEDSRDAFGDDEGSDGAGNQSAHSHISRLHSRYYNPRFRGPHNDTSDTNSASGGGNDGTSESNSNEENEESNENNESDDNNENSGIEDNANDSNHDSEDNSWSSEKTTCRLDLEMSLDNDDVLSSTEEIIEDFEANEEEEDMESADVDLLTRIQRNFSRPTPLCEPEIYQSTTHISNLPLEMIFYILRWVVTEDLDLRSLEMFSMVCRGFYICSRDSEIWRSACSRVWGSSHLNLVPYCNWRMMFLSRPRLNFNGCYVSRNTYIRHGEESFRDRFYRPWHVVEYYRYLRFFPEGMVLMLTSSEPNRSVLDLMRNNNSPGPSFFIGYYRLQNDRVSVVFGRHDMASNARLREILNNVSVGIVNETYRMELQLISMRNYVNRVLMWRRYAFMNRQDNSQMETDSDMTNPKYPPFRFSKFKTTGQNRPTRPL